jgi:hypothetical protein
MKKNKELSVLKFSSKNDVNTSYINSFIEKAAMARSTRIDLMFARFLKESGLPISKVEMVNEMTPTGMVIYFRARRGRPKTKPII